MNSKPNALNINADMELSIEHTARAAPRPTPRQDPTVFLTSRYIPALRTALLLLTAFALTAVLPGYPSDPISTHVSKTTDCQHQHHLASTGMSPS